jgi:hypothetical protein
MEGNAGTTFTAATGTQEHLAYRRVVPAGTRLLSAEKGGEDIYRND